MLLYPGVKAKKAAALFDSCDYYLDINHEGEILSAVKQAFLHNQLILGFRRTLHNRAFIAPEHVFDGHEAMIDFLNRVMGHEEAVNRQIDLQQKAAMSEETAVYTDLLK